MTRHVSEINLALYVSGDLGVWDRLKVGLHVRSCQACRRLMEAYRADRAQLREVAAEMPEGIDWNRLSREMTANIRVGLAAGECVAPRKRKSTVAVWRPAAIAAGLAVLLAGGWWLNMPPSETRALGQALQKMWTVGSEGGVARRGNHPMEEGGVVVEATAAGIELRENGSSLGVSQGTARPVAVSVSVPGSASARYVDADTGQMTITSVYTQ